MHLGHSPEHAGGAGHNSDRPVSQWQTPHLQERHQPKTESAEPDIDLVEKAFVEAFPKAPDPTSFLRLAGVPLVGHGTDGKRCFLLRVEISQKTDVGSLSPYLGGNGHRYDPLPAKMVSKREVLTFIYFDGERCLSLSLAEARLLDPPPATP
jgi:hypothetical protein